MDLARMIEFFFFFFCFQKTIHDITITRSENEELLDDTVFPLSRFLLIFELVNGFINPLHGGVYARRTEFLLEILDFVYLRTRAKYPRIDLSR